MTTGSGGDDGKKEVEWDDEAEGKGHEFALVTDTGRKWVLAVATRNDLDVSTRASERAGGASVSGAGHCADVRIVDVCEASWRTVEKQRDVDDGCGCTLRVSRYFNDSNLDRFGSRTFRNVLVHWSQSIEVNSRPSACSPSVVYHRSPRSAYAPVHSPYVPRVTNPRRTKSLSNGIPMN